MLTLQAAGGRAVWVSQQHPGLGKSQGSAGGKESKLWLLMKRMGEVLVFSKYSGFTLILYKWKQ